MELNMADISYELEDEEELSNLYFKAENGYFTVRRKDGEEIFKIWD